VDSPLFREEKPYYIDVGKSLDIKENPIADP